LTNPVKINRIMLAAPKSGSGKTLITCGLLSLLDRDKGDVISFKCGPDYIDPMFHKKVLGIYGGNLDTCFCTPSRTREILAACGHEVAVVEGVMGLYDGIGGLSLQGSSYDVARATDTPIVLIMDAKGAGRTLISTIKGILADDTEHLIKGLILNKVSSSFYERLKSAAMEELAAAGYDVKLLGFVPELKDVAIDSRHLGLLMPEEIRNIREKIDMIGECIRENCDLEALWQIMTEAPQLNLEGGLSGFGGQNGPRGRGYRATQSGPITPSPGTILPPEPPGTILPPEPPESTESTRPTLAVAMDEAFCFYYRENLELFKRLGAELKFFSPMRDNALPEGTRGIYIGGGYPELHLKELSENRAMREAIRSAVESGMPLFAECGGFMYLHDTIKDEAGRDYEMVGAVHGSCDKKEHLVRFGYVELCPAKGTSKAAGSLAQKLQGMKGHEFHYYDSTDNGADCMVHKIGADKNWMGLHANETQVMGFPHLYLESDPEFAEEFVRLMRDGRG
jgi:cobyrinic acid a,c-diamide synthase